MAETFDAIDIIAAKRDGAELTRKQISWVINSYVSGDVAEEQMSALLMAIYLRGMTPQEVVDWTQAMIDSGTTLDFSGLQKATTDKHSTGGVGDKITLPLGPLVSSFGVAVPQLSGRGLGHTGGTLDKLESIPGWKADLEVPAMIRVLEDSGAVVAAASSDLAPADRLIYALRDTTATVDSIPLIASSIMSKKIAEGTANLVLDVKVGSGAFMRDQAQATELARTMVRLGRDSGMNTRALITSMDTPLGLTIGNALEVREAVEVLAGGGPKDVVELTCALATEMLKLAGVSGGDVEKRLKDGRAMDSWRAMIKAQGGDPDAPLPKAKHTHTVKSHAHGYVSRLDALALGVGSWRLGAGRSRKEDPVQAGAGIEIHKVLGEEVRAGDELLTLHTDSPERFERALEAITSGIAVGPHAPDVPGSRILDRITT